MRRQNHHRLTTMHLNLDNLLLNDRGVAFDPESGDTYRLVGPAVHLVRLLQQGADDDGLLDYLVSEYDIDEQTARRDLDIFLHTLERLKLRRPAP